MIRALKEAGEPIDFVAGASMGAIVAAGVAILLAPKTQWTSFSTCPRAYSRAFFGPVSDGRAQWAYVSARVLTSTLAPCTPIRAPLPCLSTLRTLIGKGARKALLKVALVL